VAQFPPSSSFDNAGDAAGAFAARELAATSAPHGSGAAAIAWSRYGVALEAKGKLEAAAEAFGRAGEIDSPGQVLALADAARCWAQAGQRERALSAYARAEKLGADAIPQHVKQRLLELRAQGAAAAAGE
jgi:tetratricopeptide (TPR) repeat protein